MVVHNPNNWHWVDKNCIDWAKKYFQEKLVGLTTGESTDELYAEITKLSSLEGDCEVNQRKGKVISLFDLKLNVGIAGHVGENKLEGSITVPEVAFDSDPEDYQFDISIFKETSKLFEIKPVIREKLIPQLRDIFSNFGKQLLLTHGNDIQVSSDKVTSKFTKANQQSSFSTSGSTKEDANKDSATGNTSTANASSSTKAAVTSSETQQKNSGNAAKYNTTKVHLESSFQVPAIELYNTFIDKRRIEAWSRSPIQPEANTGDFSGSTLQLNDAFKLFGGNITMKFLSGEPGKKIVFQWRLNDWKQGHYSELSLEFHESQEYHETKLVVNWSGIPVGEEDRVRGNFEEYYIRSIKVTFGFGAIL
ncbi:Aha1p [Kluyveromyces lactis]|uniref:KLLA0A04147p n=1 Tax=Kluyveromyces lactis (strain ATCC 8585 / CBS 2359 / DSM 70799 / NBRC 1267 / NRRL Y-1140 / WM37) TaxID=284590 RepID=Q6CY06_KLULA|nr:uncharacterized protein KLLA0_A04147g [Kluyveromyces lactis]CAH02771.1 KLLA0A04147p [Kluyveromyces lactis]|eukprot:XP_451183.1 uncharacterized protein KLLA0_A04147g [Kluyveromyces lactis]